MICKFCSSYYEPGTTICKYCGLNLDEIIEQPSLEYVDSDFGFSQLDSAYERSSAGKETIVLAVSDNGEYLYYYQLNDEKKKELFVKWNNETVKLTSDLRDVYFNSDFSEIMYTDFQNTYLCAKGKDIYPIADQLVSDIVTPKFCIQNNKSSEGYRIYGFDTFKKKLMIGRDHTLYRIDNNFVTTEMAVLLDNNFALVSPKGNDLIYIDDKKNLIKATNLWGKSSQMIYATQVASGAASEDLALVYYITEVGTLYYKDGNYTPKEIDSDVMDFHINSAGILAFYLKDYQKDIGNLYYSKHGGKPQPVKNSVGANDLEEWNYGTISWLIDGSKYSVYYNNGDTDFKLIYARVKKESSDNIIIRTYSPTNEIEVIKKAN